MARIRHLKKAPITEAIVDLRATLPSGFDPSVFSVLKTEFSQRYPTVEPRNLMMAEAGFAENGSPVLRGPEDKGLHGFWFRSDKDKDIGQFRLDGFTYNKLAPYTSWPEVVAEARRLWEVFCSLAKPEAVTRMAVRYINHIKIPAPVQDLGEYFTSPIPLPPALPLVLMNFLTRTTVHDQDNDVSVNISHALVEVADPKHVTFLLDIDAYKVHDFGDPADPRVWDVFEALHRSKNMVFFGSITETTAERFE